MGLATGAVLVHPPQSCPFVPLTGVPVLDHDHLSGVRFLSRAIRQSVQPPHWLMRVLFPRLLSSPTLRPPLGAPRATLVKDRAMGLAGYMVCGLPAATTVSGLHRCTGSIPPIPPRSSFLASYCVIKDRRSSDTGGTMVARWLLGHRLQLSRLTSAL